MYRDTKAIFLIKLDIDVDPKEKSRQTFSFPNADDRNREGVLVQRENSDNG